MQLEQIAPDGVVNGELLMVGGQVLLARGFEQPEPDIEPLIQAPSLMLQLAFQMLSSVQPQGPYALKEKQVWEQSEPNLDFKISTGLATGIFAAPWNIKGSGWKTDAGHYRFELFLQFSIAMPGESEAKSSITLSGDLEYQQHDFPYDGSTDLGGWSIQWIAVNDLESEPAPAGLTLDALRQLNADAPDLLADLAFQSSVGQAIREKAFAALVAAILLPSAVMATNGYQLIGVGSYQKSLGGAVTANPGGRPLCRS